MAASLPEALLLFALHDDKGTIHSAAFLAFEHALRGAVLAELKLKGYAQTRGNGEIRLRTDPGAPPAGPLLRNAVDALSDAISPAPAKVWLDHLAVHMPDLRAQTAAILQAKGILKSEGRDHEILPHKVTLPLAHADTERSLEDQVVAALDSGEALAPRAGLLLALAASCHLERIVFGDRAPEALERADWVAERDAIVRAVREAIHDAEGY